jgi:hypothetical protein
MVVGWLGRCWKVVVVVVEWNSCDGDQKQPDVEAPIYTVDGISPSSMTCPLQTDVRHALQVHRQGSCGVATAQHGDKHLHMWISGVRTV